jgi:superfamily II helicase
MDEKIDTGRWNEKRRQREVLALVLAEDSVRLTSSELRARVGGAAEVERAVEALTANDLVVREGDKIVPTPAAIRFDGLMPIGPPTQGG